MPRVCRPRRGPGSTHVALRSLDDRPPMPTGVPCHAVPWATDVPMTVRSNFDPHPLTAAGQGRRRHDDRARRPRAAGAAGPGGRGHTAGACGGHPLFLLAALDAAGAGLRCWRCRMPRTAVPEARRALVSHPLACLVAVTSRGLLLKPSARLCGAAAAVGATAPPPLPCPPAGPCAALLSPPCDVPSSVLFYALQKLVAGDLSGVYFSNFQRTDVAGVPSWVTRTG